MNVIIRAPGATDADAQALRDQTDEHLRGFVEAVAKGAIWIYVKQGEREAIPPLPKNRPWLLLIGDDLDSALGPAAFDGESIKRMAADADHVTINSSTCNPEIYDPCAAIAAGGGRAIMIETRAEQDAAWLTLILKAARPNLDIKVFTPESAKFAADVGKA